MDLCLNHEINDKENDPYVSLVDPFLVEALQNPRHRLSILRIERDIQKFFQNSNQQQYEFQYFPTSYLRLAAHRVAKHYGLQTLVQDIVSDGVGNKILAKKTTETKYPAICLSEIPAKLDANDKPEHVKIAIKPRPNKASLNGGEELGGSKRHVKTMEERKEEYDRARARIFSSPGSPDSNDKVHHNPMIDRYSFLGGDENESYGDFIGELEKSSSIQDGGTSSRIAIFRDMEKDRTDPDYDRSYERYGRNLSGNLRFFGVAPFNAQRGVPCPLGQYYNNGSPQLMTQMLRNQAGIGYVPSSNIMSSFPATPSVYMQWATPAIMYAQSYDIQQQFRHAVFQPPFYQQPLKTIDTSQNN